jgi:signal transduction histidine kinase
MVRVVQDAPSRTVSVTIHDDGGGFVVAAADGPAQGHFGLQGMQERIAGLGGTFAVESRPGAGTTVTATVTSPAWDRQLEEA